MTRKLIAPLAASLAFCWLAAPMPAAAQLSNAQVVTSCGGATLPSGTTRAITQDTTGKLCTSGTGGGGGASYTAAAAPFSVAAGTDKPAGIDTANSAQFTEICVPGTTTCIDPTSPAKLVGGDGSTIMGAGNPLNAALNQIGSTTVLAGNGTAGAGAQRVTIASDNSAVSGFGVAATGAAPPANAVYLAAKASSNLTGLVSCDSTATYDASDNGKKTVVAGVSAKKIYVCGYVVATGGTATNVSLGSGTGADCVTTYTAITPAWQLAANDKAGFASAFWDGMATLANADNLCVNASAGNAHQVQVLYTIQ